MSKNYQSVLEKLDAALGKSKQKNRVDFKELAELKKKSFLKLQKGKNELVFLTPEGQEDPFFLWGFHNGLQETAYWSIPCVEFNSDDNCAVCNVIKSLQEEDYEKNKPIWFPIRQQIEVYAPVVNVASAATIAEGAKWVKVPKSVMGGLSKWVRNTEEDELYFYDNSGPQKIVIEYDNNEVPAKQYSLDKKQFKGFSEDSILNMLGELKPISNFILPKSADETKKIVDSYLIKVLEELAANKDASDRNEDNQEEDEQSTVSTTNAYNKLSSLKK